MAVRIRLQRLGKPKRPYYRVAVMDQRSKRDGRALEVLGQYDPMAVEYSDKFKVNAERLSYWLSQGAKPSDTVADFIKKSSSNDK
ncbi:MAG: 30S ribosomal protein S16 [Elusimicrobiota bacterium]|jgi:small subunit ribosomal protein S16|nr:30S ribosomal protein S16 [Elusimicrobiota bacterium]